MGQQTLVDWLSWTIERTEVNYDYAKHARHAITGEIPEIAEARAGVELCAAAAIQYSDFLPGIPTRPGKGRKGFSASVTMREDEPQHCRIFGGRGGYVLFEVTGTGCAALREQGKLQNVLEAFQDRFTRIDVAQDLECKTRPVAFANSRSNKRFKSGSRITSSRGETVYVGSQKSDQYCRVYRYDGEHPRSHLLRIEYVARRDEAKNVAAALLDQGVEATGKGLAARYDWRHRAYQQNQAKPLESAPRTETRHAATIEWFSSAVRPAIQRMLVQEVLTRDELLTLLGLKQD